MAFDPNRKPDYQLWNEEEFQADVYVRGMKPVERWMYRTLLQSAFFCSERPYLPADDDVLWVLAGCESREQWDEHKHIVLRRFKPLVLDGTKLIENKRVTSDWARIVEHREAQSERGQRSAAARQASNTGSTTVQPPLNTDSTKVREGKVREGKVREGESAADLTSSEPLQGSARVAEGEPGYYAEGQYGFLNTAKKAADRMGTVWKNLVGKSAMSRRPFGKGWSWFEEVFETSEIDVLIPAFEIWATERGKFNASKIDSPVMEFLKDDPGGWMKRVLPLNTFDGGKYIEPVISEELAAQQLADHKQRWGLSLSQLEEELQNEEAALGMLGGGFTPEEKERTEKHIASLKEQIEQEKAYLAGRK